MAISNSGATSTSMSSYKRMYLITTQIGMALEELTNISQEKKKRYLEAIEDKKICAMFFYAKKLGEVYAELSFHIDWDEYERQIASGKNVVKIKSKFPQGVLPPTTNWVQQFERYTQKNNFEIEWRFRYSPSVYADSSEREKMDQKLGAGPGEKIKYSKDFEEWSEDSEVFEYASYGLNELKLKVII